MQVLQDKTVGELAQRIIQDNLEEKEVKALSIVESVSSATSASSRQTSNKLNAPEKIISATFGPETTRLANEEQKKKILLRENEGIDFPDHFALESIKERLDGYDN